MPTGFWGAALQLAMALVASGVMVKLLTLRQDRRKIAGEASTQEANAASLLTGASLQMVEAAQKDSLQARKDAKDAHDETDKVKEANERLWVELNKTRWQVYNLRVREAVLEEALRRANIIIPPAPQEATHPWPPPDVMPDLD